MDLSAEREANNQRRAELKPGAGPVAESVERGLPAGMFEMPNVVAVMSVPRLGFMDNFTCALGVLPKFGIQTLTHTGAFWGQCLERAIGESEKFSPEWILTIDYDSVFTEGQLEHLLALAVSSPHVDAIAPVQVGRAVGTPLFTIKGEDGKVVREMKREHFDAELVKAATAHFGLTLVRMEKLRAMPHPWFHSRPAPDGNWGDGREDDDVYFWKQWERAGHSLYIAPRVAIGHAELMIRWPSVDFEITFQHPTEFKHGGLPEDIWR